MSVAVFGRALKSRRVMLGSLALGLAAFNLLMAALYPKFHAQAELVMKLVPSFIRSLMADVPLDRPDGYAAWVLTSPDFAILACLWPIAEATGAIAGEVERGTLSWVLAAPVSRTRYLLARTAALLLGEALILGLAFASLWLGLWIDRALPPAGPSALALTFAQAWLVYSTLGALVLLVSASVSGAAPAYAAGIALMVASAVVDLVASLWAPLSALRPLSLLSYFHPYILLRGSTVETWIWCVPLIALPLTLAAAWWVFERRDLSL